MSSQLTLNVILIVAVTAFVSALCTEAAKSFWQWLKSRIGA
jgi:hypothetical protein